MCRLRLDLRLNLRLALREGGDLLSVASRRDLQQRGPIVDTLRAGSSREVGGRDARLDHRGLLLLDLFEVDHIGPTELERSSVLESSKLHVCDGLLELILVHLELAQNVFPRHVRGFTHRLISSFSCPMR